MTDEERALSDQVETLLGTRILTLNRQPRWRKAWFAEVERDGKVVPLYLRGDKQIDAEVYPGLAREAAILRVLEASGIPVPHVYGMTANPETIVMDRSPGTRDMSEIESHDQRRKLSEQYMDILARMHSIDISLFADAGIFPPKDPQRVALSYLDANVPLYRRTKRSPQPMIEFLLKWVDRNNPSTPITPRFIQMDPGQFLHEAGHITAIYDFEASHIGDPVADFAALRLRDGTEPLGADVSDMLRYYSRQTGEVLDSWMLSYHTLVFSLTSVMALAGPLHELEPQDLQLEYLVWDLMTRRGALWALAECLNVDIEPAPPLQELTGFAARVPRVLEGTIGRIPVADEADRVNQASAVTLVQWAAGLAALGRSSEQSDIDRVESLVGRRPESWAEAEALLEAFVLSAGPEHDAALFRHFAAHVEAQVAAAVPVRERLDFYALRKLDL